LKLSSQNHEFSHQVDKQRERIQEIEIE